MPNQTPAQKLFAAIRAQEYETQDVEDLVDGIAESAPVIGSAMRQHLADVQASNDVEVPAVEIIVEVFRRTMFDPSHAYRYGTGHLAEDLIMQHSFSDYMVAALAGGTPPSMPAPGPKGLQ